MHNAAKSLANCMIDWHRTALDLRGFIKDLKFTPGLRHWCESLWTKCIVHLVTDMIKTDSTAEHGESLNLKAISQILQQKTTNAGHSSIFVSLDSRPPWLMLLSEEQCKILHPLSGTVQQTKDQGSPNLGQTSCWLGYWLLIATWVGWSDTVPTLRNPTFYWLARFVMVPKDILACFGAIITFAQRTNFNKHPRHFNSANRTLWGSRGVAANPNRGDNASRAEMATELTR